MRSRFDCIIVEDEPLQMQILQQQLEGFRQLRMVGQAGSLDQAFQLITDLGPTCAIMDVRFNGGTIFDLFRRLENAGIPIPVTILVSAHEEEAIRAFNQYKDAAAFFILKRDLDQNLKPAVDRMIGMIQQREMSKMNRNPEQLSVLLQTQGFLVRVDVKDAGFVEVTGAAIVQFHTEHTEYTLPCTLARFLQMYPGLGMIRINRVTAIAIHQIQNINTKDREVSILHRGEIITFLIGNQYYRNLMQLVAG